jgi:hypothetical protein
MHEVFVGRVSFNSAYEIDLFLGKLMLYEKHPPASEYPAEILLCGMDLDTNTPSEELMEQIAEEFVPAHFDVLKVYDSLPANHIDHFIQCLNAGINLVNHSDHSNTEIMGVGWVNHSWAIFNYHVDALFNENELSNVVSVGCHTTAIDHNDCIAEHFVIYNHVRAGVSYTGNTRSGYYVPGNPVGLSTELNKLWWQALLVEDKHDLGQVLICSKHRFAQGNNSMAKHSEWTFQLLGEPSMELWTANPGTLVVIHNATVPSSPDSFLVTVLQSDSTTPVEDALVCCWIPEQVPEVYAREYTNGTGEAVLAISPDSPGDTMYVTVTKHNYLPHEGHALTGPAAVQEPQKRHDRSRRGGIVALHPNPFQDALNITYAVDHAQQISIAVFDISGRHITTLTDREHKNGLFKLCWKGTDRAYKPVPAGIYFIQYETLTCVSYKKAILIAH